MNIRKSDEMLMRLRRIINDHNLKVENIFKHDVALKFAYGGRYCMILEKMFTYITKGVKIISDEQKLELYNNSERSLILEPYTDDHYKMVVLLNKSLIEDGNWINLNKTG